MTLLSTKAAAERMGVAAATLRYWRMLHTGPAFYRLSSQSVRYDDRDIETYMRERRYDPSERERLERASGKAPR